MQVTSGTAMPNSPQHIEITLTDSDVVPSSVSEEAWAALSAVGRWQFLSRAADKMVVEYMLRNSHISQEYAEQRIREIG